MTRPFLEDFVEDLLGHKPRELKSYLTKSLKRAYSSLHSDGKSEEDEEDEEDLNEIIAKLLKQAKGEGATADMMKIPSKSTKISEVGTVATSEGYMRVSFIEDLEKYLDDIITEEQISVPRWFKKYVQNLEPSSKREILTTLKGMSPEEQQDFVSSKESEGNSGGSHKSEKGEFDATKRLYDIRKEEPQNNSEGEEEPDLTKTMVPELVGEPERKEPSTDVERFGRIIRSVDTSANDAVDKITKLSSELQAFLNGEATAGELRRAADEADAIMDRLQRDSSFLKKYAGVKEAVRKVAPEMARMIRKWSALAQSGREAKAGEHSAISSFPTLTAALKKALENWKGAKRDPEAAMNLWEVAGELASQTEAIKGQVINLINAHDGNDNIRMAKKSGHAPSRESIGVSKQTRQLASKLLGGTQATGGMPEDYLKKQLKEKLEGLVKTQGYTQREIARQLGVTERAVSELAKYSGAELPGRSGATPSGTPERRMERVPGELPKEKYKITGGDVYGGGNTYYKKLWAKEAEAAGVDDEVVARVLRRMKEEGGGINPDELAADLGIERDQALKIMEKMPRKSNSTPVEDVRRTLFVPIEHRSSHKHFVDLMEEFDSSLLEETYNVTEALMAILELAH